MTNEAKVEFTNPLQLLKERDRYKILRGGYFFAVTDPVKKWIITLGFGIFGTLAFLRVDPYYRKEVSVHFGIEYDLEQKPLTVPFYSRVSDSLFYRYGGASGRKAKPVEKLKVITTSVKKDIPPGAMIRARLTSGASNGTVKARVISSLSVDGDILVEQGATLLGQGQSGEERLFVGFNKLVYPDGRYFDIQGSAHDFKDKIMGLKGEKVGRNLLKFGAGLGLGFVSALTESAQEPVANQPTSRDQRLKNGVYRGATNAASEQSREYLQSVKDSTAIIEVKEGTEIWVVFEGGKL